MDCCKNMLMWLTCTLGCVSVAIAQEPSDATASISGELRQWHKVTLTVLGPEASEAGTPNPFMDYRMQVTFQHPATGLTYSVPGYFAADGNAANTSATSGNHWRAHLSPDHLGKWTYQVSFRKGTGIAVSDDANEGEVVSGADGLRGSFTITQSNKSGRDLRSKGRLRYVGKHHLQFAGSGEYFLKAGVDAPENFLAYRDFDGDFATDGVKDNFVKDWKPHVQDWREGDPMWQDGKGKGMIGAINYLAGQGLNVFSFLTLNIDGDDCNVFPYTNYKERQRLDCSRLDQWEIVFSHGTEQGMYLHFKTQECENVNLLDNGETGPQRKLYYRELIARFGHHLAMNWNLGEEVGYVNAVSTEKKVAWADYFAKHDPYHHHIVIHNGNKHYDLMGDASALTGFSLQTSQVDFKHVHGSTLNYIRRSVKAGKPWVVACDEPGDAQHSLVPDAEDPTRDNPRQNALWGNLMAGGAGVEWYFGYKHAHSDLTCEDYRVRSSMWKQSRTALEFFAENGIPFWEMNNANSLVDSKRAYCLCDAGKTYLVFAKQASSTSMDLSDANGVFEIKWFDPRHGGPLQIGTAQAVTAGGQVDLGQPPSDVQRDWLAVLRPGDPQKDYPPGVSAGGNQSVMLPRSGGSVSVELFGKVSDVGKVSKALRSQWTVTDGAEEVSFANGSSTTTKVTFSKPGKYTLKLTANDGKQESSSTTAITVEPFRSLVTRKIRAVDDAYTEGDKVFSNQFLKLEHQHRNSIIQFDLRGLPPKVTDVQLLMHQNGDGGGGEVQVFRGSSSDWIGSKLSKETLPANGELLAQQRVTANGGESISIPLNKMLHGDGKYTLVVTMKAGGDDVWFAGTASGNGPELVITFEDPDGRHESFGQSVARDAEVKVLSAINDFAFAASGEFVVGYKDSARKAMAIDAAKFRDKFAAAESKFDGPSGKYDLVLTTLTETDGESSYRVLVGGKKVGEVQNPATSQDYTPVPHRFNGVDIQSGDKIRVEFNSASNGKIPEGNGFAFSRGRWRSLAILAPGSAIAPKNSTRAVRSGDTQRATSDEGCAT